MSSYMLQVCMKNKKIAQSHTRIVVIISFNGICIRSIEHKIGFHHSY